jgi:uncharacterized RmlC-like cupin family protein
MTLKILIRKNTEKIFERKKYQMAESKYGKYIINDKETLKVKFESRDPFFEVKGIKQWPGLTCQITVSPIAAPILMEDKPMKHDFDQILCFHGSDTKDIFDFDAEVELYLGDEMEKHIIDSPSVVYIPKGLSHCPINFKRIGKTIFFLDIALTSAYTRQEKTDDGWSGIVKHEDVLAKDVKKYGDVSR